MLLGLIFVLFLFGQK